MKQQIYPMKLKIGPKDLRLPHKGYSLLQKFYIRIFLRPRNLKKKDPMQAQFRLELQKLPLKGDLLWNSFNLKFILEAKESHQRIPKANSVLIKVKSILETKVSLSGILSSCKVSTYNHWWRPRYLINGVPK